MPFDIRSQVRRISVDFRNSFNVGLGSKFAPKSLPHRTATIPSNFIVFHWRLSIFAVFTHIVCERVQVGANRSGLILGNLWAKIDRKHYRNVLITLKLLLHANHSWQQSTPVPCWLTEICSSDPIGRWIDELKQREWAVFLRPHQHSIGYTGDGFYR